MSSTPPPRPPWLDWQPGDRVVVRYTADDGVHDALGELLETRLDGVRIRARRGDVDVAASTMLTGKKLPPPRYPLPRALG